MSLPELLLGELSSALHRAHEDWWRAHIAGEDLKAAYLANDLESLARRLTSATHALYERNANAHLAAPISQHPSSSKPPTKGD